MIINNGYNRKARGRMSEFKDLFIPAICGSFIGYLIYSFIKGLTNNMFYRIGYDIGQFIADMLKL